MFEEGSGMFLPTFHPFMLFVGKPFAESPFCFFLGQSLVWRQELCGGSLIGPRGSLKITIVRLGSVRLTDMLCDTLSHAPFFIEVHLSPFPQLGPLPGF